MAINKVEANGETLIDLTNDTATANDVIEGKTLHLASGTVATGTYRPSDEIEARLRATVGHSSKNLINLKSLSSVTHNGVAWTVDPVAGTITANGTATSQSQYGDVRFTLSEGNYYFSGCPSGGDTSTYDLYAWDYTTNSRPKKWDGSTNAPSDFDGTKKQFQVVNNHEYGLMCRVEPGVTVNNLVFKLMVWDGSISDDTFEPYQEPTDNLIETKARAYLTSTVGHACKNLLKITADTQTINGVTFMVDKAAGTITASGTATADALLGFQGSSLKSVSTIKNGLIYSCEGTSSNLICTISYYNSSNKYISDQRATTSGIIITIPSNANSYKFWVIKRPAAGSETFIFKPMLREASISDDTFEPYVTPTDERIVDLEARIAALEAIINNR